MAVQFDSLIGFLKQIPAVEPAIGSGQYDDGNWWMKFTITPQHPLAWSVVQELGHILNYISLNERLPTRFYPVSPPPYLNGGIDFLSWIIESTEPDFSPNRLLPWLEGRLPKKEDWGKDWDSEDQ